MYSMNLQSPGLSHLWVQMVNWSKHLGWPHLVEGAHLCLPELSPQFFLLFHFMNGQTIQMFILFPSILLKMILNHLIFFWIPCIYIMNKNMYSFSTTTKNSAQCGLHPYINTETTGSEQDWRKSSEEMSRKDRVKTVPWLATNSLAVTGGSWDNVVTPQSIPWLHCYLSTEVS